jgi:hypothetical protein
MLAGAGCTLPPATPPAPEVLATVVDPGAVAIDSTSLYVSKVVGGPVVKVPLQGGTVSLLNIRTADDSRVAVDQKNLYWSDGTSILACDKSNCDASTVALAPGSARDIVAAGGAVYWWTSTGSSGARIMKSDQTGATPAAPVQIATASWPMGLTVDAQNVYWIDGGYPGVPAIMRAPIDGGSSTMVVETDPPSALAIVSDSTAVYFTTGDGRLIEVPKSGGTSRVLLSNIGDFVQTGLTSDGTNLYVAGSNGVVSMPAHGGPVVTLVANLDWPSGIAVDDSSVYVADQSAGVILKAPK